MPADRRPRPGQTKDADDATPDRTRRTRCALTHHSMSCVRRAQATRPPLHWRAPRHRDARSRSQRPGHAMTAPHAIMRTYHSSRSLTRSGARQISAPPLRLLLEQHAVVAPCFDLTARRSTCEGSLDPLDPVDCGGEQWVIRDKLGPGFSVCLVPVTILGDRLGVVLPNVCLLYTSPSPRDS